MPFNGRKVRKAVTNQKQLSAKGNSLEKEAAKVFDKTLGKYKKVF